MRSRLVATNALLALGTIAIAGLSSPAGAEKPKVLYAEQFGYGQSFIGAYHGTPIAKSAGVVYITGRHIRREEIHTSWTIDERKIKEQLDYQCTPDYDGYILLDYEEGMPGAMYRIHVSISRGAHIWAETAYYYLNQMLETTRSLRPNAKIGFYDIPCVRSGAGPELNDVLDALEAPGETAEPPLLRLLRDVDYISPSLYYMGEDIHANAVTNLNRTVRIARQLNKDTYVHVLHRMHEQVGGETLSLPQFIDLQVTPSVESGATGVCFWNSLYLDVPPSEYAERDDFIRPYMQAARDAFPEHMVSASAEADDGGVIRFGGGKKGRRRNR